MRVYGWAGSNIELGRMARGTARAHAQPWPHVPVDQMEAAVSRHPRFKKEEARCRWMRGAGWTWEAAS